MKKIAIIGAGLTGLTTAFCLRKNNIDITLFESTQHIGGVIQTKEKDQFIWETGPSTGVLGKPEAMELFEDLEALDILETAPSLAGKRYIWKGKGLHPLPSGPISGLLTPLFSWKDKFGLLFEPFRPKAENPDENLSSFVRRRLGESVLQYAVDPFVSGVYAGSPDTIIPRYALPKLYNLEATYGSFLRGTYHKMKEPKTPRDLKATKKTFSAKGGLSRLIERLVAVIGEERIKTKCKDLVVMNEEKGFSVSSSAFEAEHFDEVIFTGSAKGILKTFPFLQNKGLEAISQIRYTAVAEVAVGFEKWEGFPLDGFGALIPSKEKRRILGILFMSSLFQNRAPKGGAMLSVFVGGERHPEYVSLSDDELKALVKEELIPILKIPNFNPAIFEISRHQEAIPQYDLLTPDRINAFKAAEENFPGLHLGGNGIGGIGMADRIKQGKELFLSIIS